MGKDDVVWTAVRFLGLFLLLQAGVETVQVFVFLFTSALHFGTSEAMVKALGGDYFAYVGSSTAGSAFSVGLQGFGAWYCLRRGSLLTRLVLPPPTVASEGEAAT